MAKRLILFLLQFCAFLGLMFFGGNWDVIRLTQQINAMTHHTTFWNPIPTIKYPIANHILIADGLLFAAVLLVLILIVEALVRSGRRMIPLSILAWILAVAAGFAMKFGLPPA